MAFLIYVLLIAMLVSFVLTFVFGLKFFASVASFILTAMQVNMDEPIKGIGTGGWYGAYRTATDKKNVHAIRTFGTSFLKLAVSFALTMGLVFAFLELFSKACVFNMSQTNPDGTTTEICP